MREDDFAYVDELYARWSPTWDFGPEQTEPVKESFSVPGSLEAVLGYYRDLWPLLMAPPPESSPPLIEAPTLTVAGRDDYLLAPEAFDASAVAFANGYEVAVTSGGHFLHREAPDEFIPILLEFLGRP
ncbi:MAG: alpha/beta hydrolase [Myxococcota bacterium]